MTKYCDVCGFRIRGKNHDDGKQHIAAVSYAKANDGVKTERAIKRIKLERERAMKRNEVSDGQNTN